MERTEINAKGTLNLLLKAAEFIREGWEPCQFYEDKRSGVLTLILDRKAI